MLVQSIGWLSSFLLVLTIGKQVWKQWRERATEGISKWLFIGQTLASAGFTTYSWLIHSWVFVVTNGLMLMGGVLGYAILMKNRRHQGREPSPPTQPASQVE